MDVDGGREGKFSWSSAGEQRCCHIRRETTRSAAPLAQRRLLRRHRPPRRPQPEGMMRMSWMTSPLSDTPPLSAALAFTSRGVKSCGEGRFIGECGPLLLLCPSPDGGSRDTVAQPLAAAEHGLGGRPPAPLLCALPAEVSSSLLRRSSCRWVLHGRATSQQWALLTAP